MLHFRRPVEYLHYTDIHHLSLEPFHSGINVFPTSRACNFSAAIISLAASLIRFSKGISGGDSDMARIDRESFRENIINIGPQ